MGLDAVGSLFEQGFGYGLSLVESRGDVSALNLKLIQVGVFFPAQECEPECPCVPSRFAEGAPVPSEFARLHLCDGKLIYLVFVLYGIEGIAVLLEISRVLIHPHGDVGRGDVLPQPFPERDGIDAGHVGKGGRYNWVVYPE